MKDNICKTCFWFKQHEHKHQPEHLKRTREDKKVGYCMRNPPVTHFRQGAVHTNQHWSGDIQSVINPGVISTRPETMSTDTCSGWSYSKEKEEDK